MAIETSTIEGFLSTREGCLVRRESQILEFKRSFTFAALAEYFRDFAAFANNRGGYILFGVEDSPRRPTGLSESALERFSSIDPRRITEPLLSLFAPVIDWEAEVVEVEDKSFGVFRVEESSQKPFVAKKNQGDVKDGEIYYRYRGQTRKIRHEELSRIIAERIEEGEQRLAGCAQGDRAHRCEPCRGLGYDAGGGTARRYARVGCR